MNVEFSWREVDGKLEPHCDTDVHNHHQISILASLLMDDGGIGYHDSLSWLNEGLKRAEVLTANGEDQLDWSRDAWGAAMTKSEVTIYSLYDETYSEKMSTAAFKTVLAAWISFLQSRPDITVVKTMTV